VSFTHKFVAHPMEDEQADHSSHFLHGKV